MIIAPSLLAADYGRLRNEIQRVERSGADWLHLDIMDGHFVPNISFGPELVRAVRSLTRIFFDVHMMCTKPEVLIESFVKAGADQITIHAELGSDRVRELLWKIRSHGKKVGLAVNPPTGIAIAAPFLNQLDLLLVMTVNPGFGGQGFIHETLPKIQQATAWKKQKGLDYRIQVDGGIYPNTAAECARAGADTFVSGVGLFSERNMAAAVRKLRRAVEAAASLPNELRRESAAIPR